MSTPAPTLLVMAAGMGSRYGGLKQIDPIGPHGEIVIDYSVFDALEAGFGKVVFIIRRDIEADFKAVIEKNIARHIPVEYVFQDMDDLPEGFSTPDGRTKPWGTAHAIYAARDAVKEPFAAINADDFYGKEAYRTMAAHLAHVDAAAAEFSLVAYVCRNTLSDHGAVTRGVCEIADGKLQKVVERMKIEPHDGAARYNEDGTWFPLTGEEPVSMNFWGFTPVLFRQLAERFPPFLEQADGNLKAEFLIPTLVDELINDGQADVIALHSQDRWLGVTYPEDKAIVTAGVQILIDQGTYAADLWASV